MFQSTCSKCGKPFETKNPKRVVCPECLYPDRPYTPQPASYNPPYNQGGYQQGHQGAYPQGGFHPGSGMGQPAPAYRPQGQFQQGHYQQPGQYGPPRGPRPQGGGGFRPGGPAGFGGPPGGFGGQRRPGGPGFGGPPRRGPGGFGGPRRGGPPRGGGIRKKLLVSREELEKIEKLYKAALPLPNPDVHEVIGHELDMKPSKVFFAINLIRQKMKLSKLDYPKRKLAVTPEQLMAVEALYEPFLPLPPIGVHKILSKQLKMDEWRVHVAIGLIRKNKNMDRWNEERTDLPDSMKESLLKKQQEQEAESRKQEDEKPTKEKEGKKTKSAEAKLEKGQSLEQSKEKEPTEKETVAAVVEPAPDPEQVEKKPVRRTIRAKKTADAIEEPGEDALTDEDASVTSIKKPTRASRTKASVQEE